MGLAPFHMAVHRGMVGSAYVLISANREYARGDNAYEQVRRLKETTQSSTLSLKPEPVSVENPAPDPWSGQDADFAALARVNPEIVAWIKAQDSVIDYPVVQGKDNSYYLNHLFTGKANSMGSPFVDYRTPGDFSGAVTIIYGHYMKNGSMFASLAKHKKQSYYDAHPVMELYTPDGDYTIELFAGIIANGSIEFLRRDFDDDEDYLAYIETLKNASTFRSNVTVRADDRIVALITCSYEFSNARYAVFGKLVPHAEMKRP